MYPVFKDMVGYLVKGGWMMLPLTLLGIVLFASIIRALLSLWFVGEVEPENESAYLRRLRILKVLTSVAPLLGLLGTVAGMLKTFRGLATKGTLFAENLVAVGISEALVTTQFGLSIGVIGLTGIMLYRHFHDRYQLSEYQARAVRLNTATNGGRS
ncbi:MAG: MotA/TolQ/ExbB proton channel family protein [Verrucomicrobiae bacterium]|nr:MotA/TolQ/ExbB proton channel family protein [Verrucomicrobiae bacterium]